MSEERYIVSARKYRPASFDTVVGQKSITDTLVKAISTNHLAQAYLFCGPRGVGKTTCARIFAKEINRFDSGKSEEDFAFNIFELDAASNNSVDDIRSLIDQVRIPPQEGKYKVYIIDEVHMLSQAAFNAFLKTLEEPPKHAVFVLATTEKHKIIPTILSRCQVFDFNRITIQSMVDHLAEIAKKENIQYEEQALHIIAEKADGGLRDALSIFDQVSSFSDGNINYQQTIENLNVLDYDFYFRVVEAIKTENISEALVILNEVLNKGFDGHNFVSGLAQHIRNLIVANDEKTLKLLEVSEQIKKRYIEQAKELSTAEKFTALNVISETDINYKTSKNKRLSVELCLMQLCSIKQNLEKKNSELK